MTTSIGLANAIRREQQLTGRIKSYRIFHLTALLPIAFAFPSPFLLLLSLSAVDLLESLSGVRSASETLKPDSF
jgi:hypothetical protein